MFLLIMNENNMKNREYDVKNGLHSVFYISNRVFFHIGKWFDLWSPTKQNKTKNKKHSKHYNFFNRSTTNGFNLFRLYSTLYWYTIGLLDLDPVNSQNTSTYISLAFKSWFSDNKESKEFNLLLPANSSL